MEIEKFFLREFNIDNEFERQGGEALVSKAQHSRLGHKIFLNISNHYFSNVAIKRWMSDAYNSDNEIKLLIQVNRFPEELNDAKNQNCNHPNIIKVVGILLNSNSNAIGYVMPYMPNGSLHDVIHSKSQSYAEKQMSSWITQICYGLSYLHSKKIIHRDTDILLGKSHDDVKLSDFGMARSLTNISHSLTKGLGTIFYMAPEILKGKSYTMSADVYSLSITIWEILHRRQPFDHFTSHNPNILDLCNRISDGERPSLRTDLSKEAVDVLEKCWDVNIAARPTIDEVLELLDNTGFVYLDHKNAIEGNKASFEKLNVSNDNDDDNFSKTITAYNVDERPPIPPGLTSEKPPFPKSIKKSPDKETIILLGGRNGNKTVNSFLILQNNGENHGNWKKLKIKLPYASWSHGAQFLDNYLYIFGGEREKYVALNSTYKLTKDLQWEKMADMNQKRSDISNSSVILNYRIWVIGGSDGKQPFKSVEMYDPSRNKWKYMKGMNECRSLAAAAVVNGKIFCCGGSNGSIFLKSAECYDPSSDVWILISDMPGSNIGCGAVEMDGNLIVIEGKADGDQIVLGSIWVLDTTNKNAKWIEREPRLSRPRCLSSIAKIHKKIFVCGGFYLDKEDPKLGITDDVEILDGEVWRNGPKMPTRLSWAPAVVIPMDFAIELDPVIHESSGCSVQ